MNTEPSLLIIARIADEFDLAHFPWPKEARAKISVNSAKFHDLEMLEIIFDGMPFLLSRCTAAETGERFAAEKFELLFRGPPTSRESAISVALRDNLTSAKHLPVINHRLLLLGKWIGESLQATAAAWLPSRTLASFAYFDEVVGQYLAGGPFPTQFQTSFSQVRNGYFVTSGLNYFAGQEIRLTAPLCYSVSDVTKRLVRIIHDVATHGKIVAPARSEGMVRGETLFFSPSDDLEHVDIRIDNNAIDAVPAKM